MPSSAVFKHPALAQHLKSAAACGARPAALFVEQQGQAPPCAPVRTGYSALDSKMNCSLPGKLMGGMVSPLRRWGVGGRDALGKTQEGPAAALPHEQPNLFTGHTYNHKIPYRPHAPGAHNLTCRCSRRRPARAGRVAPVPPAPPPAHQCTAPPPRRTWPVNTRGSDGAGQRARDGSRSQPVVQLHVTPHNPPHLPHTVHHPTLTSLGDRMWPIHTA